MSDLLKIGHDFKWDPRRSGARCVQELTRGKLSLLFPESKPRTNISRSINKQPLVKLEENKTVLWSKQWTLVLKWKDMENMRVLEQVASNPSWASQGLSVPRATQQRDPQSNLLQSLLQYVNLLKCSPLCLLGDEYTVIRPLNPHWHRQLTLWFWRFPFCFYCQLLGGGEKEEGERGGHIAPASLCRQAKRICATKHPDGRKNSPFTNWIPGRFL